MSAFTTVPILVPYVHKFEGKGKYYYCAQQIYKQEVIHTKGTWYYLKLAKITGLSEMKEEWITVVFF